MAAGWQGALIKRVGNDVLGVGPQPQIVGNDLNDVADQLIARHTTTGHDSRKEITMSHPGNLRRRDPRQPVRAASSLPGISGGQARRVACRGAPLGRWPPARRFACLPSKNELWSARMAAPSVRNAGSFGTIVEAVRTDMEQVRGRKQHA